jgi:alpha-glucosidase
MNTVAGRLALALLASAAWPASAALADDLTVERAGMTIHVTAIAPDVMRVRMATEGQAPEDASWAVTSDIRKGHAAATRTGETLATAALRAVYDPASKLLHFENAAGQVIFAEAGLPQRDGNGFTLRSTLAADEHIYGLGDKTGPLDRHGQSFVDWNTDSFGFGTGTDPLYKSIPFFISSGARGGAYGVLLDNTWRTWFDFGHRTADRLEMGADNGPIDYYVIAGPTIADVTRRYADLTGHAPLAPRWALGYQQSRYSYMSEAEVRSIAQHLRDDHIPTDVIWLDIDYQDRNRPFTINTKTFPHFAGMVHDLDAMGIKTITIVDLHVADAPGQGYLPYDSGVAGDHFAHRADGRTYVGPVWPGPAVFPEFTDAGARQWWGTLFAPFVHDGVAGFWNDMNEPAIFDYPSKTMPPDVRHRIASDDFAPRTATHAEIHNVYGMLNTRATYEGLRALSPDERAFVMTRASYAGGQRYAATWTGDNSATWDHLKLAVAQTLNLGLSGFAYTGTDVGGFAGGPPPDLMTRWFEYSAFLPVFRDHSATGTPRAEPWVDGPEQLAIRRHYVEARYRLMPFLYGLAEANARTGDPIARPVAYDYRGTAVQECDTTMSFTLGGRLLISGAPRPEQRNSYQACLPDGGWYDYWTGDAVKPVPSALSPFGLLTLTPRLDMLPVFVRAGTILPRAPLVQSTSQRPDGPLELDVYPGPDCHGEIYDDDGHSTGFAKGAFARQQVTCLAGKSGVTRVILAPREGHFAPWWKTLKLTIHGGGHYTARLGGKAIAEQDGTFTIADQPSGAVVELAKQ